MAVYDAKRDMSPAAVDARLEAALAMVAALCHGERRWTMSIPAQPGQDPDLVIADALRDVRELRQAHDRRVTELLEANNREVERRRAAEAATAFQPTHRHVKRGSLYQELGPGLLQTDESLVDNARLVIYRGTLGDLWARREAEFDDGRFERVDHA